ncbi:MAG: outer-membrane lipoprotein carrier protein LolA [Blastocatellia bacterium]|nr:outer-membrane lipoprotein carrier protein LolA [Blastocatellia bacterium]
MKQLKIFFPAVALLVAASFSTSTVGANGRLDQVLNRMQQAAKGITTLYAKMNQVKRLKDIGGRETNSGDIIFKHKGKGDDRVRINYDNGQQVSVDGKEIILYQPSINQAIITNRNALSSENQEFAFFSTPYSLTAAQLKSRYTVVHLGEEQVGGVTTSVLKLTPKGKSSVREMKWWVDHSSWLPIKTEVVEQNEDVSTFTLSNMKLNGGIADSAFKIKFRPGTKVIKG